MDIFKKWEPVQGITTELQVKEILVNDKGLRITLAAQEPTSKNLNLFFQGYLLVRNSDESGRIKLWAKATFEDRKWPLCITTSSQLIDWLHEESDGVYDKNDMTHYLVKTGTDVVDIIANQSPEVSWLS